MKEALRTNDPVALSFAQALLRDAGIPFALLDAHASVMDGSIPLIRQRLMVADDDLQEARAILKDALGDL